MSQHVVWLNIFAATSTALFESCSIQCLIVSWSLDCLESGLGTLSCTEFIALPRIVVVNGASSGGSYISEDMSLWVVHNNGDSTFDNEL